MKNNYSFLLPILSGFILLASCSAKDGGLPSVKVYDKAVSGNVVQIPLESICQEVEKITIADVPGNVNQILETPDYYFIIFSGAPVAKYDKQGNLVQTIGNIGRGPGEYLYPRCLGYIPDGSLLILDYNTQSLLAYNIESGEHISTKDFMQEDFDESFILTSFLVDDGKVYFFTPSNYKSIVYSVYNPATDEYKKVINKDREMAVGELLLGSTHNFGTNPQYVYQMFNDTLFTFNNGNFQGKLLLDIDNVRYSFSELSSIENYGSVASERIIFNWLNASDNHLLISYLVGKKSYLGVYDFATGSYSQNAEITTSDPAAGIVSDSRLFSGFDNNMLLKVNYPENEDYLEIVKYKMK